MSRRRLVPRPIVWRASVRSTSPPTAIPGCAPRTLHEGFRCEDLERLDVSGCGLRSGHHAGRFRARVRLSPRISRGDAHGASRVARTSSPRRSTSTLRKSQDRAVRQNGADRASGRTRVSRQSDRQLGLAGHGALRRRHLARSSGTKPRCPTTIYLIREEKTGTIAEFMDVFVTRKV